jgi:hypothetical protein
VADDFANEPLWGWKDPRTCLTLPFWQDLIIGPIRYVMCVRNPCAVVASLGRRNGMSPEQAERLWLSHVQCSLAHTGGRPRMFVFYEEILDDWARDLRRLAAFIARPERGADPRVHASVGEFVEKKLCHHRISLEDLAANQQVSFATKSLYIALRGNAPRDTPTGGRLDSDRAGNSRQRALDLLGTRAIESWDQQAALIAERTALALEYQQQAAAIEALGAERIRMAAEASALNQQIVALSGRCLDLEVRGKQLTLSVATLESELRDAASELRNVVLERDDRSRVSEAALQALREIHTSRAWHLVTSARQLVAVLFPAGTRRRRFFNAVVRPIARRLGSEACAPDQGDPLDVRQQP